MNQALIFSIANFTCNILNIKGNDNNLDKMYLDSRFFILMINCLIIICFLIYPKDKKDPNDQKNKNL